MVTVKSFIQNHFHSRSHFPLFKFSAVVMCYIESFTTRLPLTPYPAVSMHLGYDWPELGIVYGIDFKSRIIT